MMHTVITVINIIFAFGFFVFLGFLFTMVKKESGRWTALLVVIIGLALIKCGSTYPEMDNHLKEFTLYDSPIIKSNRQLRFETKLGGLITVNHFLDLYVPKDKNDSTIRIVKQNSVVLGWTAGFHYKVAMIRLVQSADDKIKYTANIHATSRILGLLNYSDSQIFVGER